MTTLMLPPQWQNIANPFDWVKRLQGEVFRQQNGRKTLRFMYEENAYFVKTHEGVGWREIFKNLFLLRSPVLGAQQEWCALTRLKSLNIATMELVAYGKRGGNPAKQESFVITKALESTLSLEDLCRQPISTRLKRRLVIKIAMIARRLHENGVNHRDFYLCHFLLDNSKNIELLKLSDIKLYLIDLHRTQLRKKTPNRWKIKDIAGLYFSAMDIGLTQNELLCFWKKYTGNSLRQSLSENRRFLKKIAKRAEKLYAKTHFIAQRSLRHFFMFDRRYDTKNFREFLANPDAYLNQPFLKNDATTSLCSITLDNKIFVVKRYNAKSIWHRIKRSVRHSRAQICWEKAQQLKMLGIATAPPAAYIEMRAGPFRGNAYYVTEFVESAHALNYFTNNPDKVMAKSVLHLLKQLHRVGLSHGDLKATNILIAQGRPLLIDLDSMRFHKTQFKCKRAQRKDIKRFKKNWIHIPELMQLFNKE